MGCAVLVPFLSLTADAPASCACSKTLCVCLADCSVLQRYASFHMDQKELNKSHFGVIYQVGGCTLSTEK